jgi:hypothetical protein
VAWAEDALSAAEQIAAILESLGVRYMLGGSMASAVWSEPRFTRDVDMVADLKDSNVAPFLRALGERWYADETLIREAITRRSSFNVIRFERMVKVDVFVPPDSGFHASKWGRVRRAKLSQDSATPLAITSPEDIVLQKLDWYRTGGEVSELQWRDVTSLLRTLRSELERSYLDEWAQRMGLAELLERAWRDAQR